MYSIKGLYSKMSEGISKMIFPSVCLCCGEEPPANNQHICHFCLHKRFEDANPKNRLSSSGVLLPDRVVAQHALWHFDKGGALQNLMHHLKYERLTAVGIQLGQVLARRIKTHHAIQSRLDNRKSILLPVPLHYLKFRKRGFNQAFFIAKGIEPVLDIPICSIDAVIRKKFTLSQTGFTLEKRINNVKNAFKVRKSKQIRGKLAIIIDDVFTTGATSFELAKTLKAAGAETIMIWTVAQA